MAKATPAADVRICRMHDLVVRDASGHSRAFRFGERVEMTAALAAALGDFVAGFVPVSAEAPAREAVKAEKGQE